MGVKEILAQRAAFDGSVQIPDVLRYPCDKTRENAASFRRSAHFLAMALMRQKRFGEAQRVLVKAIIEYGPHVMSLADLAQCYISQGAQDEAEHTLTVLRNQVRQAREEISEPTQRQVIDRIRAMGLQLTFNDSTNSGK